MKYGGRGGHIQTLEIQKGRLREKFNHAIEEYENNRCQELYLNMKDIENEYYDKKHEYLNELQKINERKNIIKIYENNKKERELHKIWGQIENSQWKYEKVKKELILNSQK